MNKTNKIIKTLTGKVVSELADKTITVVIDRVKTHPIYRKKYNVSKKYRVHDPENKYHVGDVVDITSSRPISKNKYYQVVNK